MALAATHNGVENRRKARQTLVLGALGIVYGDIGTSPLYTVKQCFQSAGQVTEASILGALSLIAWALTAVALRSQSKRGRRHRLILAAGLVGASLFFGDGVITPAISVLSAVEGLKIATPLFDPYVIPITIALLVGLFVMQRRGSAHVGGFFGPVMAIWFITIAGLGLSEI